MSENPQLRVQDLIQDISWEKTLIRPTIYAVYSVEYIINIDILYKLM